MKLSKNIVVIAGIAGLVVASYFGFGAANKENTALAETKVEAKASSNKINLDSEQAKLGYTFGAGIGQDLARGGMSDEIDIDAFVTAIRDLAAGNEPQMSVEQMQQAQQAFQLKREQQAATVSAENKAKGDAFLATNKAKDGVKTTESGLQYEVLREGKGKQPTAEQKVKVHYLGKLIDDTTFDSSYQRNEPAEFPVSGVIPGFSEGLQLMKEGAKYKFTIPAGIAYGEQGPGSIGPNQVLIFEVELLEVI